MQPDCCRMIAGKGKIPHGRFAMRPHARLIGWFVLLFGVGMAWGQGTVPAADRVAIKAVLNQFRDAVVAKDGEAVVKLLDAKTIGSYEDALKDAVSLPKA